MMKLKTAVVIIILFVGFVLRFHNYSLYPQRGASSDEYTYSFLGISLLTKGVPESWSNLGVYRNLYDLTIRELYFPMVHPYFDHPPLNGLLVGGWSILNNQKTFESVNLRTIRLVPIFLSVISSLLVFFIGLKLFNYRSAVWALLIYSTATIFVMNQRVVFAENLLTPLFLGALCTFVYIKKLTVRWTILLGLFAGLSFWTKELGIAVFLTLLFFFIKERKGLKQTLMFSTVSILFFIGYLGYGYFYSWDQFLKVIGVQAGRPIGPDTLLLLMSQPVIVNKVYLDGWYFLGFLSLFFGLFDFKRYKFIFVPAFVYLMLMIFSINRTGEMGWYHIVLFPFMAIMTADLIRESINTQKQNWFIFLLLLFVGLYEIKYIYEANFGLTTMQFRVLLILLFGPFIFFNLLHKDVLFKKLSHIWFYTLIFGTIFLTYTYMHPS